MAIIGLIVFSSKKSGSDTGTSPVKIIMHNITFSPASVMVNKGTVVKWQNDDDYAHNVNSNDSITFSSGVINGGGSFSYTQRLRALLIIIV